MHRAGHRATKDFRPVSQKTSADLHSAEPPSLRRQAAPRTAPYYSLPAWRSALDDLFSEDSDANRRAVARVAAWRFRARTLGFATEFAVWYARLQALQGGATPMADEELAALYSMALLRLVNGLVEEVATANRTETVSVFRALQVLRLPRSFGVFRHDATHGALPGLAEVRAAARQAMAWLRTAYWQPLRAQAVELEVQERQSPTDSSGAVAACPREVWWEWHMSAQANDSAKETLPAVPTPSPVLSLEELEAALEKQSAPATPSRSRWELADDFEAVPIGWLPPEAAADLFGITPVTRDPTGAPASV
eukprot:EG_transcript_20243